MQASMDSRENLSQLSNPNSSFLRSESKLRSGSMRATGIPPLYLKAYSGGDDLVVVDRSPFRVGRRGDNHFQVVQGDISGRHAEFRYDGTRWWLCDCHSTNGTFVNGQRVSGEAPLSVGDTIHIATKGYLLIPKSDDGSVMNCQTQIMGNSDEIRDMIGLLEVINENRVYPFFQPIIDLRSRRTVGWEALGRATAKKGALSPGLLFSLAHQSKVESKLSTQFRETAIGCTECQFCWPKKGRYFIFINIHPAEIRESDFLNVLDRLSQSKMNQLFQTVVEMPESWVGNTEEMRVLVKEIRARNMLVAYDDFGTGQSRIPDLISVPPDFIKLDRQLVSRLDDHKVKRSLVKAVVDACRELRVKVLAEGIETAEEMKGCMDLGVELGQGFLICRPQPAFQLFAAAEEQIPSSCPFVRLELLSNNKK